MNFICLDGKFLPPDQPVLLPDNRSYRYGDGLFETIRVQSGFIHLKTLHFERLFTSIKKLGYETPVLFKPEKLEKEILQLCKKNNNEKLARVRLSVFRGSGGLYDENNSLNYLIESWSLTESVKDLNENGLTIGIYTGARKSCDEFSNLKSANFLPYVLGARFAKANHWNDALILNSNGNIADATIANVFLVIGNIIITPSLMEGCIAGVMRHHLLASFSKAGYAFQETVIRETDLRNADEVFLTNAIHGIKWVKSTGEKQYRNDRTRAIYNLFVKTIE